MNKRRLLLLLLPLVAGAVYLRSLASWRPRLVFQSEERQEQISHLLFSDDGHTLFVASGRLVDNADALVAVSCVSALNTGAGWGSRWQWRAKDQQVHQLQLVLMLS